MCRHLADGLGRGLLALGLVEEVSPRELTDGLERDGIDAGLQVALGALRIRRARAVYVRHGAFDPMSMIALVAETEREARLAGYRGLCAAGDMSWALSDDPGADRLVEYEYLLGRTIFSRLDVVGLCLYDARRFDPGVLRHMSKAHPVHIANIRGSATG